MLTAQEDAILREGLASTNAILRRALQIAAADKATADPRPDAHVALTIDWVMRACEEFDRSGGVMADAVDERFELEWRQAVDERWRAGGSPSSLAAAELQRDRWKAMGYECHIVNVTSVRTIIG